MIFDPKIDPKTTQDGSKTGPRGFQKRSLFVLIFAFDFGAFWDPLWVDFGSLLGPNQDRTKIEPKIVKKISCGNIPPTDHSKRPQARPKRPQDFSKRPQDPPRKPPRPSQEAPKRLQEGPKTARDSSK